MESVSNLVGTIKGRSAIRILSQFWARGYCVDTVGLDLEMIKKYVKYQDDKDK